MPSGGRKRKGDGEKGQNDRAQGYDSQARADTRTRVCVCEI